MKKFVLIASLVTGLGAVAQTPAAPPPMPKPGLTLTTPAFDDGGIIPNKYTQAAENGAPVSPKLTWTNVQTLGSFAPRLKNETWAPIGS